jgi:hypothetical protein
MISEAAIGGEGVAQRPYLLVKEPKKTGVRSVRAHKHDKNPLVLNIDPSFSYRDIKSFNALLVVLTFSYSP